MDIRQYVVDAFTDRVFSGNPAAICITQAFPADALMQQIARENRLSETAFAVGEGGRYCLRWFTPGGEIDLCGHATLGTAYAICRFVEPGAEKICFNTMSGELIATRNGNVFEMDFPAYELARVEVVDAMSEALGVQPAEAYLGRDLLCVLDSEDDVRNCAPGIELLRELDGLLVHITARGRDFDCVSRSFAPKLAVDEDPVCGSGHCHIAPYWARVLGKDTLRCWQASERGGELVCTVRGNRVTLGGRAVLYSEAIIHV